MSTPYNKSDFKVGQEVVLGRDSFSGNYWRGKAKRISYRGCGFKSWDEVYPY